MQNGMPGACSLNALESYFAAVARPTVTPSCGRGKGRRVRPFRNPSRSLPAQLAWRGRFPYTSPPLTNRRAGGCVSLVLGRPESQSLAVSGPVASVAPGGFCVVLLQAKRYADDQPAD